MHIIYCFYYDVTKTVYKLAALQNLSPFNLNKPSKHQQLTHKAKMKRIGILLSIMMLAILALAVEKENAKYIKNVDECKFKSFTGTGTSPITGRARGHLEYNFLQDDLPLKPKVDIFKKMVMKFRSFEATNKCDEQIL